MIQGPPIIIDVPPDFWGPTSGPIIKFADAPGSCAKPVPPKKEKSKAHKSSSVSSGRENQLSLSSLRRSRMGMRRGARQSSGQALV